MKKPALYVAIFLLGGVSFFLLGRVSTVFGEWRTIQVIRTPDRTHRAELQRLYGYIDVNFKVLLDGKKVYHSPDFAPAYDRPFREWITWDKTAENIVFIAADQILFAYNLNSGAAIPPEAFASLDIPRYSLHDIGFEGDNANKMR